MIRQSLKQKFAEFRPRSMSDGHPDGRGRRRAARRLGLHRSRRTHPESDGTARGRRRRSCVVEAHGGGEVGLGYTYGDAATGRSSASTLADGVVEGSTRSRRSGAWRALGARAAQLGRPGIGVDGDRRRRHRALGSEGPRARAAACDVLGAVHERCRSTAAAASPPTPTSGCTQQLGGWVAQGIPRVKMKVGREPERDLERVRGGARRRSATRPSSSSTPTAPTRASRRSRCAERSPSSST